MDQKSVKEERVHCPKCGTSECYEDKCIYHEAQVMREAGPFCNAPCVCDNIPCKTNGPVFKEER